MALDHATAKAKLAECGVSPTAMEQCDAACASAGLPQGKWIDIINHLLPLVIQIITNLKTPSTQATKPS